MRGCSTCRYRGRGDDPCERPVGAIVTQDGDGCPYWRGRRYEREDIDGPVEDDGDDGDDR